ncbi:MAG: hypothetical protein KIH43_004740, partial [Polynucleobacter sp.]|nr:hypothetical protein [Polynucleobacter sp.]
MKNQLLSKLITAYSILGLAVLFHAYEVKAQSKTPDSVSFFATVNGTPLTNGLLELNIKAAMAQGQKDSPELQRAL